MEKFFDHEIEIEVYFNDTYPDTLLWFIPNCHQDIDI